MQTTMQQSKPETSALICAFQGCRRPFQPHGKTRRFCSCRCSGLSSVQDRGQEIWRKEETHAIERWAGLHPFPEIVRKLQLLARRHGWQPRKPSAVRARMCDLGLSRRCVLDNFTASELGRVLGVAHTVVHKWKRDGLSFEKISRNQTAISIKAFKQWAVRNPHRLCKIDRDRLLWLIGDENLVDAIIQAPSRKGEAIAIKRVDTGEIYNSLNSAARLNHLSVNALASAIRAGRRFTCGIEWEVLTKRENLPVSLEEADMLKPRYRAVPPEVTLLSGDRFDVLWYSTAGDYTLVHWRLTASSEVSLRPVAGETPGTDGESLYLVDDFLAWDWYELVLGNLDLNQDKLNHLSPDPRARINQSMGSYGLSPAIAAKLRDLSSRVTL